MGTADTLGPTGVVSVRVRRVRAECRAPLPQYMTAEAAGMDLAADLDSSLIRSGEKFSGFDMSGSLPGGPDRLRAAERAGCQPEHQRR